VSALERDSALEPATANYVHANSLSVERNEQHSDALAQRNKGGATDVFVEDYV
jgi:hypothetical protein